MQLIKGDFFYRAVEDIAVPDNLRMEPPQPRGVKCRCRIKAFSMFF